MTSTDPVLFWQVFAAVLGANLLTVMFVWGCSNVSRREDRKEGPGTYLIGVLMPLLVGAGAFYLAMGGY